MLQMDSTDNVTLCWLPGSGIIQDKRWLLKSHMALTKYVNYVHLHGKGIQLFEQSMSHEFNRCSQPSLGTWMLMLWSLLVLAQFATIFGNMLSALSIGIVSLINCISCCLVWLRTYWIGYSNTWELEIYTINATVDPHQYLDIRVSNDAITQSMHSKPATTKVIPRMIRTLAVKYAPIHFFSKNNRNIATTAALDVMVVGTVCVFCEFSLLVSGLIHSHPAL